MSPEAFKIPLATAEVTTVPCCVLFLRGALLESRHSVLPIWTELARGDATRRLRHRSGATPR